MKDSLLLKALSVFLFVVILVLSCTIPFYFESPSMFYKFGMEKVLLRTGKIFGLVTFVLLIFQPLLAGRFVFLDKVFGQDKLLLFHKRFAIVLLCFAVFHPVFILWAENFSFFPMEKRYWPAFLGIFLLNLIILMVLSSTFRALIGLRWHRWIIVHRILAPTIMTFAIIHVLRVSKPFESGMPNKLLLGAAFFLGFVFIRKWLLTTALFKKKYQVVRVKSAAKNAWSVDLEAFSNTGIEFSPGQFAYIMPIGKNIAKEEHPFTIASAPGKISSLQFVIRSCGDFTNQIPQLQVDDTILIDGAYGNFCHVLLDEKTPLVMIAGGIGITPMLSMLRAMAKSRDDRKIILIWSNKTKDHIIFGKEFLDLDAQIKNLRIYHVLTRDLNHQGTFNRIDKQSLMAMLKGFDPKAPVFLCGPPAMVEHVKEMLKFQEFSSHRVYTESFVL